MTHDELVTNLGTIAHSGSGEFLKTLSGDAKKQADLSLIGQFGVGFYSAFMIADRVRVRTRSYREEAGWQWESEGTGSFTVTPAEGPLPRGTEVILHLKDDAKDLASPGRIKEIVRRYSSFVPHPIRLGTGEVLNDQKPIWVEPKSQVTEEQYARFYQHLTHHTDEKPLWHLHLAADSPIQFRAVLYCPPTNLERFGFARLEHGVSLCAKRVLVQNDCRELVPEYLRFLRGLVDSEDLPLNVSRETLQDNTVIRRIRTSLVKAVFDRLDQLAKDQPEDFQTFYAQFGQMLKEGAIVDPANRERIAKLLRFASSHSEDPEARTSLDDYIARMPEDQKRIYYLGGPDLASIRKSPNLEIFRRRGLEVLFLTEPIDEFVMNALGSYGGKPLTSIDSDDLELPESKKDEAEDRNRRGARVEGRRERLPPGPRPVPRGRGPPGAGGPRVEPADRQPLLPGQCRGGLQHPDAAADEAGQQGLPRDGADPRDQPVVALDPPPLPPERQPRARRVHQAVRAPALVQRDDPGRDHPRGRGPGFPGPGLHGRGGREAVAVDPGLSELARGGRELARPCAIRPAGR